MWVSCWLWVSANCSLPIGGHMCKQQPLTWSRRVLGLWRQDHLHSGCLMCVYPSWRFNLQRGFYTTAAETRSCPFSFCVSADLRGPHTNRGLSGIHCSDRDFQTSFFPLYDKLGRREWGKSSAPLMEFNYGDTAGWCRHFSNLMLNYLKQPAWLKVSTRGSQTDHTNSTSEYEVFKVPTAKHSSADPRFSGKTSK